MVLMKGYDAEGFVFYSHIASARAANSPQILRRLLLFHWKSLRRQVQIRGNVSPVTDARPTPILPASRKQAQIGAWASKQSQPLESRFAFRAGDRQGRCQTYHRRCPARPGGAADALPPCASRFWHDRPFRLHDRIEFRRDAPAQTWSKVQLYP